MTHEELNAALDTKAKLDRLNISLEQLMEEGGIICNPLTEKVTGGQLDGVYAVIDKKMDEIRQVEKDLELERQIVGRLIDSYDMTENVEKVMKYRYVECLPFKQIPKHIGYTERQVYRFHNKGLKVVSSCQLMSTS